MILSYSFRTWIERFKENQVAFEDGLAFNMGQLLSIPFILIGLFFAFGMHRKVKLFHPGLTEFKKVPVKIDEKVVKKPGRTGHKRKT